MKYARRPPPELWDKIKPLAREHRKAPTPAEELLWQHLRRNGIAALHFRRQHVFEKFIVDFYYASAALVVEVDGEIHDFQKADDALRTEFLEALGLRVIRFRNDEVLDDVVGVLMRIAAEADRRVKEREPGSAEDDSDTST